MRGFLLVLKSSNGRRRKKREEKTEIYVSDAGRYQLAWMLFRRRTGIGFAGENGEKERERE